VVRWSAVLLLAAYVLAALLGRQAVLTAQTRAGSTRDLAYIADLTLGLAAIALIAGLARSHLGTRALAIAIAVGGGLAALYAVYQWPAQHFGWPLADVNNTLDSNGATAGGSQGTGLFGWERVRGTFLEPHFLAAYAASLLPLAIVETWASTVRLRWLARGATVVLVIALALSASLSTWMVLVLGVLIGGTLVVIARGWVLRSAGAAAVVVLALAAAPIGLLAPDRLAAATGRDAPDLVISSEFRRDAWQRALDTWSERPVLGFGPGQSAVRSALVEQRGEASPPAAPQVLGSSQGLWAAALVDVGVVGFGIWCAFLGAIVVVSARAVLRDPAPLRAAVFTAAIVALVGGEVAGDRLDLRVWVLLGLLLGASATARGDSRRDPGQGGDQPQPRTG
jgi:hypothetical protein